jgi:hypothetical protein
MKKMNNEPKEIMKPGTETEAVAAGQRRAGKSVYQGGDAGTTGLKRAGCGKNGRIRPFKRVAARLGPGESTQVVDFPHLAHARLFREQGFYRRVAETQSREEERDRMDNDYRHNGRNGRARPVRRIRILTAIFVTERSLMFAYVRLCSLKIAYVRLF